jgi:FemAB-related protein (PEP-CTERM system-associated)
MGKKMIQIKNFQKNSEDRRIWDAFVMSSPDSTSDHLWAWRDILNAAFGFNEAYYLGAYENGCLRGILPLFRIPRGIGKTALTSIPFGNYGGVCAETPEIAEALIKKAIGIAAQKNARYLELKHQKPVNTPALQNPRHSHSRYFLSLKADPQIHWKEIGQNNRSKIQRAKKWGLTTSSSKNADLLYPLYVHTARRQGVPCFPKNYFEEILRNYGENSKILFANYDGKPVAYYLCLYFKNTMLVQFAGALSDYYTYYPNELLFWTALEEACALSLSEFDFCRSRIETGTAEFKKKLRFKEDPCDSQYYLPAQILLTEAKAGKSKFRWASRAWQQLPLKVTESLGPVLLRYFA